VHCCWAASCWSTVVGTWRLQLRRTASRSDCTSGQGASGTSSTRWCSPRGGDGANNRTYAAVAGYAGGKGLGAGVLDADGDGSITPKENNADRVCYHNRAGVADYGRLGHAEVVAEVCRSQTVGPRAKVFA
jgi:hypothetical protein